MTKCLPFTGLRFEVTAVNLTKQRPPICYIIGAGELYPDTPIPVLRAEDLLICADAGYRTALALGLTPDLVIGDFDSLGEPPLEGEVVRLPVEKDVTDTEAALLLAERRGYRTAVLFGCTGGRPDHTYAAEQLVVGAAARSLRVFLIGSGFAAFAICRETARFSPEASGTLSVFAPDGVAAGVTLSGLKYPLLDATLTPSVPLGVSNSFLGEPASVSVKSGTLLLFAELRALPYLSFS